MHHKRQDQGRKNHKSLRTAAVHRRRKATTPRAMLAGMLIGDDAAGPVVHPSRQAGAGFTRRPALPPPQEEPENGHIKPPLPRSSSAVSGHSTSASCHIVGAGKGWRMPPNRTYYADWASTRQISIGDKLRKAAAREPFLSLSTRHACMMNRCLLAFIWLYHQYVFLYRSGAHNIVVVEVPTRVGAVRLVQHAQHHQPVPEWADYHRAQGAQPALLLLRRRQALRGRAEKSCFWI